MRQGTDLACAGKVMGKDRIVRIAGTIPHSLVDGPGVRFVIFFQGCPHRCRGCHNPDTHDTRGGTGCEIDALVRKIQETKYLDGVTLSGGEPFLQPEAVLALAEAAREAGLSVWCYTGWTFEELLDGRAGERACEALRSLDVLVDGRYREDQKAEELIYRGSANQRIIDVPGSLRENRITEAAI